MRAHYPTSPTSRTGLRNVFSSEALQPPDAELRQNSSFNKVWGNSAFEDGTPQPPNALTKPDYDDHRDRSVSSPPSPLPPLPLDPAYVAAAVGPRPSNVLRSNTFQALLFVQDNAASRMAFR